MLISQVCKNYFDGFSDAYNYKKNDVKTNVLSVLRIFSYFTVVIPLCFATLYGIASLYGRIREKKERSALENKIDKLTRSSLSVNTEPAKKISKIALADVFDVYNPRFLPRMNRSNLEQYGRSEDFKRHARSARLYYNERQLKEEDALRIIFQREPTNIAMGSNQYKQEALNELFGYTKGIYNDQTAKKMDGALFKDLPNTVAVYSETYLWSPHGKESRKEIACLSLPAPALDSPKQPHYNYYIKEGKLDAEKYEKEMEFLFSCVEKAIRDNKDIAFNNKGIKRVVLSKFGQGAFLAALNHTDQQIANQAYKNQLTRFLTNIANTGIKIVMSEYSQPANPWYSEILVGDIIQQAKEHDLIINAWDPHSAPGNGNDADASFDGAMGKATGILLTQTAWLNETLRSNKALIAIP